MKFLEKALTATDFKAQCLKILDELGAEGVIITKRGRLYLPWLGFGLARGALLARALLEKALLQRSWAAGELRLQERVFAAHSLAELLVEKTPLRHR